MMGSLSLLRIEFLQDKDQVSGSASEMGTPLAASGIT